MIYRSCIGGQKCASSRVYNFLYVNSVTPLPSHKERSILLNTKTDYVQDSVLYDFSTDTLYCDRSLYIAADSRFDVRVVIVGRDPLERTISAYWHYCRTGKIKPKMNFKDVFRQHPELISKSLIGERSSKWISKVGGENIFLTDFKKITDGTSELIRIANWLEIKLHPKVIVPDHNDPKRLSKSVFIERFIHDVSRYIRKVTPVSFHMGIKRNFYKILGGALTASVDFDRELELRTYVIKNFSGIFSNDRKQFLMLMDKYSK